MNRTMLRNCLLSIVLASLLISGCGPGQLFGPTVTPSPTSTSTPTITPTFTSTPTLTPSPTPTPTLTPSLTPIPGIGAPIIVNGISVQVKSAELGAELPSNFFITNPSKYIALRVDFDFLGDIEIKKFVIVDENGYQSNFEAVTYTVSGSDPAFSTKLFFAVKKDSHHFSLHLPDGQVIDLTPVLVLK